MIPTPGKIARARLWRFAALALAVFATPRSLGDTAQDAAVTRADAFLKFIRGEAS